MYDQLFHFPTKNLQKLWEFTDNNNKHKNTFTDKQLVRIFQTLYANTCIKVNDLVNFTLLSVNDFNKFWLTSYIKDTLKPLFKPVSKKLSTKERLEIDLIKDQQRMIQAQITVANVTTKGHSELANFKKSIRQSKEDYEDFRTDKYWDKWWQGFKATAELQGFETQLNWNFILPSTTAGIHQDNILL